MAKHKVVSALNEQIAVTIRKPGYRSIVMSEGLDNLLKEAFPLKSESNDNIITNFSHLVSRTVSVELVTSEPDEQAQEWVKLWSCISQEQYLNAYYLYLDLVDFVDDSFQEIWDKAILSASDIVLTGDADLKPPSELLQDDQNDPKKKKSA